MNNSFLDLMFADKIASSGERTCIKSLECLLQGGEASLTVPFVAMNYKNIDACRTKVGLPLNGRLRLSFHFVIR